MSKASCGKDRLVRPRGLRVRRSKGGFTLVEMAVAMAILVVSLLSIGATTLRSHTLRIQNRERVIAHNALRSIAEQIHAQSYLEAKEPDAWSRELIAWFSPGGAVGATFDVAGLQPVDGAASVGTIEFVTDEQATDAVLGVEIGMPRDLNGDGDVDDNDVGGTASLLPVVIRMRWVGINGDTTLAHPFYVMGY
jgi:prepilin-type N-terminal cleavage/methylation domain-containing protein